MRNILSASFMLFLCFITLSCALLVRSRVEDIYFREGAPSKGSHFTIILKEIVIQKDLDSEIVRQNAENIFNLLINKHNQKNRSSSTILYAYSTIKEDSFLRDYESLNAVTIEIRLFKQGNDEPEIIFLFSEETKNTVSSYKYLYSIIKSSFRRILP